ncbi:molybdate ABC transporter substrate-binding protein [Sulfurovum sp. CS9]|uniref:molybdate ABC transporter substrate-binding protein n=1 Tax=Sulfurovum sp. CS9 TaxID=3391146 RepID=UPI0039E8255B
MNQVKLKLFFIILFSTYSMAGTIQIAVAANVSYAIDDLKKEFSKLYPDTKVKVTLGSSGKLTAQIKNGAPYQLFMSANMKYPNALYKDKTAVTKPIIYAQGAIALFSNKAQDFTKGIKLLKDKKIEKIAIANPKTAPYGKAAVEAMKNAGVYNDVKKKFVYAESISQTVSYTVTATDMGIIAKSSLFSPKMAEFKKGVNWGEVDPKLYAPIDQGIVILKEGEKNSEVEAFYNFILSEKSKKTFEDFGYTVP